MARRRMAPRPPSPLLPLASSGASASVFPRPLARGSASPSSAGASWSSSSDTTSTPESGPARGSLVDESDVLRLPVAFGLGDLEADLEMGAAALRTFALGKAVAKDREPFSFVREDESEVLDFVEPEHLPAHRRSFRRETERAGVRRAPDLSYAFS